MKHGLRKNNHGKKKVLIAFLFFILLSSTLAGFFYFQFWAKKPLFISPLASDIQKKAFGLEKLLTDSDIEFSSVVFRSPSTYLVKLKEDGEAILSVNKDFKEQIASLQAVIKQLTIEGKRFVKIDFRFDKTVIELQK